MTQGPQGERGPRGFPAPPPSWWKKHRAVFGYLFLLAVTLLALELHHDATARDLNRRDAISCEQRQKLASNQKLVLDSLLPLVQAELKEHQLDAPDRDKILATLELLKEAQAAAGPQPCE